MGELVSHTLAGGELLPLLLLFGLWALFSSCESAENVAGAASPPGALGLGSAGGFCTHPASELPAWGDLCSGDLVGEELPPKSACAPAPRGLAEMPYLFLRGRPSNRLKCLFLNHRVGSLPAVRHRLSLAHAAGAEGGQAPHPTAPALAAEPSTASTSRQPLAHSSLC